MINFQKIISLYNIQTDEDANFFKELIDTYITQLPEIVQNIAASVEKDDCNKVKFLSHRLKGSSITIGVDVMTNLCKEIEDSMSDEDITEKTRVLIINLLELYEPLIDELKHLKEKHI